MSLPIFQSQSKDLSLLQTNWASQINPVIAFPPNQGLILQNIALASGDNQVNHLLGRKLQGWILVRNRASSTVYDKQDANNTPSLTLALNASAQTTVDIWVF